MGTPLEANNQRGDEAPKPSWVEPTELKTQATVEQEISSSLEQNLQFFWRAVSRGKYIILAASVAIAFFVYIYCKMQTPMYKAQASLLIEPMTGDAEEIVGFSQRRWWLESDILTEKDVIQSRLVADRVVQELKLNAVEPFKSAKDPAQIVLKVSKVEASTKSRVLTLSTRYWDPALAAQIANEMLNSYMAVTEERARADIMKTVDQMRYEITRLKKQVDADQMKVKQYEVENPELASKETLQNQIQHLNEELAKVSSDRMTLRTELEEMAAFQQQGRDVREHPTIAKDTSVEKETFAVQQKEVELTQLLSIYKERFPLVIEKRAELETVQKILAERKVQIINDMKSRYILLAAREHELRNSVTVKSSQLSELLNAVAGYDALMGELEVSKNLYAMLLERMDKASIVGRAEQSKVKILSKAEVPSFPYSPQTKRNVSLAFAISLAVMSYLVYLFFLMLQPIESEEEIVQGLKVPVLAQVPMVLSESEEGPVGLIADQESGFARDALHVLGAAFVSSGRRALLFTSSDPSEGKTFMVHNLGVFLARTGKRVLLVGTDFRDLHLKKRLNLDSSEKSLEAYLNGKCLEQDAIQALPEPNLFYMGPAKEIENPLQVITSPQFEYLIRKVNGQFDYVFYDAPPVRLFSDSEMLSQLVKDVVFVVRYGRTPYQNVAKSIRALRKAGTSLMGVILNYRTLKAQEYYYHKYYYGKGGRKKWYQNVLGEAKEFSGRIVGMLKERFVSKRKT